MTLFGLLWLSIITYCFLKKDIRYMAFVTLLFMCFQSVNVLYLNGKGIGPQILTSILFICRSFPCDNGVIRIVRSYKNRLLDGLLVLLLLTVCCSSLINNIFQEKSMAILQLALYIVCFACMERALREFEENTVYMMLRTVIVIIAVIGLVQWLTTIHVLPFRIILKAIIYNEDGNAVAFNSLSTRLYSTFMEPSYFAGFVVGAFYYLFSISVKWKENVILMSVLFIELLLSRSSTGFGAFLIVGIIFIIVSRNISIWWKFVIIVSAAVGFMVLYLGFYDLLDTVIFSKAQTGSYRTRNAMNDRAIKAYLTSPWLGTGYKEVRGSSIVSTLLGQLGGLGLIFCSLVNLQIGLSIVRNKGKSYWSILSQGASLAFISVVVCQIIACPDLDLCTYWFWMYAVAMHLAISGKCAKDNNT